MTEPVLVGDAAAKTMDRLTAAALIHAGIASYEEAMSVIDAALQMATAWAAGGLSLDDVRRSSTPAERFLLARFVRPMPPDVVRLFDALVDTDMTAKDGLLYRTKHGLIPRQEMPGALTTIEPDEDGGVRIRFASLWPWITLPDPKAEHAGDRAGRRGEAIFANGKEDRARFAAHPEAIRPRTQAADPWDL